MSPEEIIHRALERFERPHISHAKAITGDLESARDAVQETFLRLSRQDVTALEPRLAPWLFLVCRNCALDHRRKVVRFSDEMPDNECVSDSPPPDAEAVASEEGALLRHLVSRLPEQQRELAASPSLQSQLDETIQLADALGTLAMPNDTLPEKARTDLLARCAANQRARQRTRITSLVVIGSLAAAACVLVSLSLPAITGALSRKNIPTDTTPPVAKIEEQGLLVATSQSAAKGKSGTAKPLTLGQPTVRESEPAASAATAATPPAAPVSVTSGPAHPLIASTGSTERPVRQFDARSATVAGNDHAMRGDIPITGGLFRNELQDTDRLRRQTSGFNTEAYDSINENTFLTAKENPLSTFSIDVDTASYANVRRFLQNDQLPPAGAIRTEELLNYFSYAYPQPTGDAPFSVSLEVSRPPWDASRELVRIGLKGRDIPAGDRAAANLVFLIDVSGSMETPDKLPLLKRSLEALVQNLAPTDRVAIVVYAGSSGLVLPPTPGTDKTSILSALDNLQAGGSTNGASGIQLAYNTAREHFLKNGNNRVILCTDGDFNVGTTDQSELVHLIENERASGVFLSVLGFGTGNLKDSTMEKLANRGNGNYAYIDSLSEGRKVLVEQMDATLFTIAKDVKIQVEFNPARVAGYRLIGYENRLLAKEDFKDDKKDAGEIGAGHTVTALYEIIPVGQPLPNQPSVDPLKYQSPVRVATEAPATNELLTLKLRYKAPDGDQSRLMEVPLRSDSTPDFTNASSDFQFAAAVAAAAMKLRNSPDAGDISWDAIKNIVRANLGEDPGSYRAEFLTILEKASRLQAGAPIPGAR